MATSTNDFNVWDEQTPVVSMAGDGEFNVWDEQIPVVDRDEGSGQERRRAFEF